MSLAALWRQVWFRPGKGRARAVAAPVARFAPQLECLEGRLAPSVSGTQMPIHLGANAGVLLTNQGNTITVVPGNGNGTYQLAQLFSASSGPVSLTMTDLNADGRLDLVAVNFGSSDLSALLVSGDGTYQSWQTLAADGNAVSVSLAYGSSSREVEASLPAPSSFEVRIQALDGQGGVADLAASLDYVPVSAVVGALNGGTQAAAATVFVRGPGAGVVPGKPEEPNPPPGVPCPSDLPSMPLPDPLLTDMLQPGETVVEATSPNNADLALVATLLAGRLRDCSAPPPAEASPSADVFRLFRPGEGTGEARPLMASPVEEGLDLAPPGDEAGSELAGPAWLLYRSGTDEVLRSREGNPSGPESEEQPAAHAAPSGEAELEPAQTRAAAVADQDQPALQPPPPESEELPEHSS